VKYLVVTPVKDEERYVEHTLRSMASQTIKPVRWIIVDDGSSDRTPDLIESFAQKHGFIHVVRSPQGQPRGPGPAVVRAFNRGLDEAGRLGIDYDFVVKLDCDLSFEPDYFERLLAEFGANPKLGIASGVYWEARDGVNWREIEMPAYHAAGASKVIRRVCWEQIYGFIPSRGWDTVDEIRAISHGWETTHFRELRIKHWKTEGTGIGKIRTNAMHGEIYYLTGGGVVFFLLKVLARARSRPYVAGALSMVWGYWRTKFSGRKRLVTPEEARCYRSILNARMIGTLRRQRSAD
jgi:glycosyltransferase involved in cell wall biosynthesis